MKKIAICAAFVLAVLVATDAQACTATQVYERARQAKDTEYYKNARDAILTDTQIQGEDWQYTESVDAAAGTMLHEAAAKDFGTLFDAENYSRQLDQYHKFLATKEQAKGFLDMPSSGSHGAATVRDHALLHGNEWEDIINTPSDPNNVAKTPWIPQPKPVEPAPVDHAG